MTESPEFLKGIDSLEFESFLVEVFGQDMVAEIRAGDYPVFFVINIESYLDKIKQNQQALVIGDGATETSKGDLLALCQYTEHSGVQLFTVIEERANRRYDY